VMFPATGVVTTASVIVVPLYPWGARQFKIVYLIVRFWPIAPGHDYQDFVPFRA
jgi:hypothetical protein